MFPRKASTDIMLLTIAMTQMFVVKESLERTDIIFRVHAKNISNHQAPLKGRQA
jgi:hypothetical protein